MVNQRVMASALTLTILMGSVLQDRLPVAYGEEDAGALKGSIIHTDKFNNNPTINPDELKDLKPGSTLDMVVSTALTTGVNVNGDEFFAKVSKDYVVDGKVVIPRDTIVHGVVEQIADPKRAGRNGWIATKFDYMITPDGREIPIEGKSTTKDSGGKAAAKVVGRASGFTLAGGLVGAALVLKYGGLAAVTASNGYALAGGAAVGGAVGLTTAMVTKGRSAMIEPGTEIRVKLNEELSLPTVNMPDPSANDYTLQGLDVKILGMRLGTDPFGEPSEMTLTLDVNNHTENTFSNFEIGLEDEYGNVFYPSPFGDTGMWFERITPNTRRTNNITFSVDNPKLHFKLVFFKQYSREPIAKFALTDAMVILDGKGKKKRNKDISRASTGSF